MGGWIVIVDMPPQSFWVAAISGAVHNVFGRIGHTVQTPLNQLGIKNKEDYSSKPQRSGCICRSLE
jgi:hypothetical protein